MKKIILFDIDYTLFNTDKFRDLTYPRLQEILQQEDNPHYHEKIKHIEKALIATGGYEPVGFGRLLMEALSIKGKNKQLEALFYDEELYKKCLYPEVTLTIELLSKKNFTLGIVSKGEFSFQKRKIQPIEHYFAKNNIFISNDKIAQIDAIKNAYKSFATMIIDDSEPFLNEVKNKWKEVQAVLIERQNRYETRQHIDGFVPDVRVKTLDQVLPLVDKLD